MQSAAAMRDMQQTGRRYALIQLWRACTQHVGRGEHGHCIALAERSASMSNAQNCNNSWTHARWALKHMPKRRMYSTLMDKGAPITLTGGGGGSRTQELDGRKILCAEGQLLVSSRACKAEEKRAGASSTRTRGQKHQACAVTKEVEMASSPGTLLEAMQDKPQQVLVGLPSEEALMGNVKGDVLAC
eukprot:1161724-Pelagomonas_calceolata.AAC.8